MIGLPWEIGNAWNTPVRRLLYSGAEERGPVAVGDPLQQAQVQFSRPSRTEHPPETVALPAGDTLHIDLGHG